MPKKEKQESQEEQSERFKKAAQEMIEAGELNLIDAENAFEVILKNKKLSNKNI